MSNDLRSIAFRWRTAVHEAGHAVAAYLLGGTVHRVVPYPHEDSAVHCDIDDLDIWPKALAVVNLAGPLADARWHGIEPVTLLTPAGRPSAASERVGAGDDLRNTRALAQELIIGAAAIRVGATAASKGADDHRQQAPEMARRAGRSGASPLHPARTGGCRAPLGRSTALVRRRAGR
jgi:hypothetical protein